MTFYKKYLKYKNKYSELKMTGGQLCSETNNVEIKEDDIETFIQYIQSEYECTKRHSTEQKYIVILYGPPASGKTEAFKESCKLIKEQFNEQLEINDIMSTFINTGLDDLIYRFIKKGVTIKKQLIVKMQEILQQKKEKENNSSLVPFLLPFLKKELTDKDIIMLPKFSKDFGNESYKIYNLGKIKMDYLSTLLIWFAVYINKNILFETSIGNFEYINKVIDSLAWAGYIPIIIYPYSNNLKTLYNRNAIRALQVGRFIECSIIQDKMKSSIESFNDLTSTFNEAKYGIHGTIVICSYDNTTREKDSPIIYNNLIVRKNRVLTTSTVILLEAIDPHSIVCL
jgi:hypothetical protein